MSGQILYALVARGTTVLAESTSVSGNANMIAQRILDRLPPDDTRVSYSQERHLFHILVSDGITFLCMADESMRRRLPFGFLEDLRERYTASHGAGTSSAIAYEYNREFAPMLRERMDYWSNNPQADTIGRVKTEILDVKGIMIQNIEKVLDRGEKIELLVHKTDALAEESFAFRREARGTARSFMWKNIRLAIFVGAFFIGCILLYAAMAYLCGPLLNHCL